MTKTSQGINQGSFFGFNFSNLNLTQILYGLLVILIMLYIIKNVYSFVKKKLKKRKWHAISQQARNTFINKVKSQKIPQMSMQQEIKEVILRSDATNLIQLLQQRKVTSEQILITYFERASTIGMDHELITNIMFEKALEKARQCDHIRATNPNLAKGLMFGIPFSVKDNIQMQSLDSTVGMACRVNKPCLFTALSIELLEHQGGIPFLRSNLPQLALCYSSKNFIFGNAQHPLDRSRTVGGSSGGEAGLVLSQCSPIGIGNDQGGSLRVPASFCGVYTLKPTAGRITLQGGSMYSETYNGNTSIPVSNGPMAKSINDINLFMKCQLDVEYLKSIRFNANSDLSLDAKPWDEQQVFNLAKSTRIGYIEHVGVFPSCDTAVRAVNEAVQVLKDKGIQVVKIECDFLEEFISVFYQLMLAEDDIYLINEALEGEETIPEYNGLVAMYSIPNWVKPILAKLLSFIGQQRMNYIIGNSYWLSCEEFFRLRYKQQQLINKLMDLFKQNQISALITPSYPSPAFKHNMVDPMAGFFSGFTFLANVANLPAGIVPVTFVKEHETLYQPSQSNPRCKVLKAFAENLQDSEGMPMGVQVIGLPWQEEHCLSIMREIDSGIQFKSNSQLNQK